MKAIVLTITGFVLLAIQTAFAQYTVTYHTGTIKTKNGAPVTDGMKLGTTEQLAYDSPKDELWVILAGKGEYQLHVSAKAEKKDNLWIELITSSLHLKSKKGVFYGRPGMPMLDDELNIIDTISIHLLLQAQNAYLFDPAKYNNGYFTLQVAPAGGPPFAVKLKARGDTLLLDASTLKPYLKPGSDTTFQIGYVRGGAAESIATINPVIDGSDKMKNMMGIIIHTQNAAHIPRDTIMERCYWQVYNALGKPCMLNFDQLFDQYYPKTTIR